MCANARTLINKIKTTGNMVLDVCQPLYCKHSKNMQLGANLSLEPWSSPFWSDEEDLEFEDEYSFTSVILSRSGD